MKLSYERPSELTAKELAVINEIAAEGFGIANPADMLADTLRHVETADVVQRAHHEGETIGFALYLERLWRTSY
ncbi:MAG TPA: hypothetical protein VLG09_01035 [Candidatus Saccharimonadales bacterium]|nr:hypothetical protein [Candidatus Saccharimonadales bacterium]